VCRPCARSLAAYAWRISRRPEALCTGSTMIEIKTMTPLSPAARITAQRRKDSAGSFLGECDWATGLPAPRIVDGFMTASFISRGLGMDLQPDLTFAVWCVVPRARDLWLPQAVDTIGPWIPRSADAADGAPR
jgi:hypothetical protein